MIPAPTSMNRRLLQALDSDRDGFPDALEIAISSPERDFFATPLGFNEINESISINSEALAVSKIGIKLSFASESKDSIAVASSISKPKDFKLPIDYVLFNVGGCLLKLCIDEKGVAKLGKTSVLKLNTKGGDVLSMTVKYPKDTYSQRLEDDGFTNETISKQISLPVSLYFGTQLTKWSSISNPTPNCANVRASSRICVDG